MDPSKVDDVAGIYPGMWEGEHSIKYGVSSICYSNITY